MDLTFHIIFVPGTVRYLRLAVASLLRYSSYRYRIVSNGLQPPELTLLKQFAESSDRLEFYAYPTTAVLPHGTMLTLLEARERSERFCFMDSDIFADAPFGEALERELADCDVFSSCDHLWVDDEHRSTGLTGRCLETPTGLALATTFFAVYRTEPLRRVIADTGVGFERHGFAEHYADAVAAHLRRIGLSVDRSDTGKLLSVMGHEYGLRFRYARLDGLCHIGGISGHFLRQPGPAPPPGRLRRLLRLPFLPRGDGRSVSLPSLAESGPAAADGSEAEGRRAHRRALEERQRVAAYFALLLRSLFDGTPEPAAAFTAEPLAGRVRRMTSLLRQLYDDQRAAAA